MTQQNGIKRSQRNIENIPKVSRFQHRFSIQNNERPNLAYHTQVNWKERRGQLIALEQACVDGTETTSKNPRSIDRALSQCTSKEDQGF